MRQLPIVDEEPTALQARWPEPVLELSDAERRARVRTGRDTVILDGGGPDAPGRGFVRAVLRVPLGHPKAVVYGVFVEVDRPAYLALKRAHAQKQAVRVWGRLATRLPYLEGALDAPVEILEDGSELRARVVDVKSELLRAGPPVGARR